MSQTFVDLEGAPTASRPHYSQVTTVPLVRREVPTYRVCLRTGEDGWIVAQCIEFPGAISQGKSRDEALRNIVEALTLFLEETSPEQAEFAVSWEEK